MSRKYGLNGNDLNWDFLVQNSSINEKCTDCRKFYNNESKEWEYPECEGHTIRYSQKGWSLFHNTNGNSASIEGNPPLDIYNNEYLIEWASDAYDEDNRMVKKIWEHLKEGLIEGQNNCMKVIGSWGLTNTSSMNIYVLDLKEEKILAGINNFVPEWYDIDYGFEGNEEDNITYITVGKGKDKTKYYLNECMRVTS